MIKIKFVTLILISLFIISCDNSQNENEKTLPEDELGILEKNELSVIDKAFKNEIALIKSDSNKSIDIIEFSSFTCSHCADFHNSTLKEILSSEVGGKINYYIIDFPLDYFALFASQIGNCIIPSRLQFTNIVYDQQKYWKSLYNQENPDSKYEIEKILIGYAMQLGNSEEVIQECLSNEKLKDKILNKQLKAQKLFKVESTPTFIIDGDIFTGNRPSSEFIEIINKKLKK
jgi:protein-disulfide isomerase